MIDLIDTAEMDLKIFLTLLKDVHLPKEPLRVDILSSMAHYAVLATDMLRTQRRKANEEKCGVSTS